MSNTGDSMLTVDHSQTTCTEPVNINRWKSRESILRGPIRGIFDSSRHYSNLKDLFLRKAASPSVTDIEWVPEADNAVYKEWASLITSVKSHLRRLTFEQAAPPSGSHVKFGGGNQTGDPWIKGSTTTYFRFSSKVDGST